MEEFEHASLVSRWWQTLTAVGAASMPAPQAHESLGRLVDELAAGFDADPFDPAVGERAGMALVTAGLSDPAVPAVSAQVLHRLAADSARPDADRRVTSLLAALGRGHHEAASGAARDPDPDPDAAEPGRVRRAPDEMFRIAVENAPIAIALGDTQGDLLYANPAMSETLGVSAETLERIAIHDFAHPEDQDEINNLVLDLMTARQGTMRMERRLVRADGSVRWTSFSVTYVRGSGEQPDFGLAVVEDVTEQHRLREELHWQARHDQLTGLPNRRLLREHIEAVTAIAAEDDRMGLCFVDLDQFKQINDRYGHATGDQVLVAVADRLRETLSGCRCLAARVGGDEFVVLIPPPADDRVVTAVADRLLTSLNPPIAVGDHRLEVSASIGAVTTPVAGQHAEALLDAADRGLYRAKADGKHRWALHLLDRSTGK